MLELPCPSCGGPLKFRSKTTLFTVCSYCRSNVIRKDMNLEKIGEMAELPEDLSPIQIGTTGRYNRNKFYVAGRIIYRWSDGIWNEWYLLFDNGKDAWMAEAQGEFIISYPIDLQIFPSEEKLFLDKTVIVQDKNFKVTDIKKVHYIGSEGELPFKAESNYRSTVYDFSYGDDLFLTMEYPLTGEDPMAYYGKYVELAKLDMHNLRILEGWG